jgi:hypothetical protein
MMSISVIVAVDPSAKLPIGAYIGISVFGVHASPARLPIDTPGSFMTLTLPLPSPQIMLPKPGRLPLNIEASVRPEHPIKLEAIVPAGGARLTFHVLPGGPEDSRFSIEGDVLHPRTAAPTCAVRCLPNGTPKGPGECVECENDDAIVRLCC